MHWPCTAGHGVCPCVWISWAVRSCWRKLIFPLEVADSGRKLLSHTQGCVHLLRPEQALCMRSQSEWVQLCLSLLCFLGVCLSLCPYNPPVAPSPMLLNPKGGFDETSPSALVFQGLSLCTLSAAVSICSHFLQEEASLTMADETLFCEHSRMPSSAALPHSFRGTGVFVYP